MGGTISSKGFITKHDKAVLKLKGVRDMVYIYTRKAGIYLVHEKELAKTLLRDGKKTKARIILKKTVALDEHLKVIDLYLEQLEKAIYNLSVTELQSKVNEAIKRSSSALKVAENIINIKNLDFILLDSPEGLLKQLEIEKVIKEVEIQDRINNVVDKELIELLDDLKQPRNTLNKKAFKLKNINLPKSSSNIAADTLGSPSVSDAKMDESKTQRGTFVKVAHPSLSLVKLRQVYQEELRFGSIIDCA